MLSKKIKILVLISSFLWCGSFLVSAQAAVYFKPSVEIPGMGTLLGGLKKVEGFMATGTAYVINENSLGNYISGLYDYAAGFVGIVAMLMLVLAGWQWLTAAGASDKINSAKDTIGGVMIGLVLLFGGHVLLSQISVSFVNFGNLSLAPANMANAPKLADCLSFSKDSNDCNARPDCSYDPYDLLCKAKNQCPLSEEEKNIAGTNNLFCCYKKCEPEDCDSVFYYALIGNDNLACDDICPIKGLTKEKDYTACKLNLEY
jgi:hypothetical protein